MSILPQAQNSKSTRNIKKQDNQVMFNTARENSIEVYDDPFGRNSILTRSARMRKFKFYQFKTLRNTTPESTAGTPRSTKRKETVTSAGPNVAESDERCCVEESDDQIFRRSSTSTNNKFQDSQESCPSEDLDELLRPRRDMIQGRMPLSSSESHELTDVERQIGEISARIATLTGNSRSSTAELDEILLLVNQKNDLVRRQMQLNIVCQERALERTNQELTKELRMLMNIDDSRKSEAELARQKYLYEQSVALVNRRNELVLHMDEQERCIEDDNKTKATLERVISGGPGRNTWPASRLLNGWKGWGWRWERQR